MSAAQAVSDSSPSRGRATQLDSAQPKPSEVGGGAMLRSGKDIYYTKQALNHAKALKANMTEAEKRLWYRLRRKQLLNCKFRKQQPIQNYIVDFVCLEHRLIVEVDGGQHAESAHDEKRDAILASLGYTILRFWNNEVMENIEGVLQIIAQKLNQAAIRSGANGGKND
jgi:very-short-patch-repair endonuclease